MLPWAGPLLTHIFVAVFVLVIMFVAVPAREKMVNLGEGLTPCSHLKHLKTAKTRAGMEDRLR